MSVRMLVLLIVLMLVVGVGHAQNGLVIEFEQPLMLEIEGNGELSLTFAGQIEQVVTLSAERFPPNPDSQLDLSLELYTNELLASDDDSGAGLDALVVGTTLPTTGVYQVVVRNNHWQAGTFQLTLTETPYPADCQTPLGEMVTGEMSTQLYSAPIRYRVFLPPCHETTAKRYPYILLMHGSNSDDRLWDTLGMDEAIVRGVALKRLPPMAVVMPFGSGIANTNIFSPSPSWETIVVDELVPHVESLFCLQSEREGRAIGGISRGGFWAYVIGLRHPELFATVGGHSPFFDLYHAPATHNPLDLASAPAPNPLPRLWLDHGDSDYARLNIQLMHERLTENSIPHIYRTHPVGQHNNAYWGAHLDEYLTFYSANWFSDVTLLPDCL